MIGLSDHVSSPDESFWAVRTFFEALARRRPLVLVFDDIHWGEATFLDLVDHLAELDARGPLLLVCVARPELHDVRAAVGRREAERDLGPPRASVRGRERHS